MKILIDTPFLSEKWLIHPNIIGKMPDDRWIYMSLEDYMLPYVRGCIFTVSNEEKVILRDLALRFNEDDLGCQFALLLSCDKASTLIVEWESYAACKHTLCQEVLINDLNQIECDFFLTHIGSSTSIYRECIRKQIDPALKINSGNSQTTVFYLSGEINVNLPSTQ